MGNKSIWGGGEYRSFNDLCSDGDIGGVQAAIDNGADVNEENVWGGTGLMRALGSGHNNVVQLLLQHPQIDVNKTDSNGGNALHWAAESDNHEGMKLLLDREDLTSGSINCRNQMGRSPIVKAVQFTSINCFHLLLANPLVDLDTRDDYERSAERVQR